MRTEQYEKLLEELERGELTKLERQVFNILKSHPDGVTRKNLVFNIYNVSVSDLNGSTHDRKIRKAIESLRNRLVPIVSSSGAPGYKLDVSREHIEQMMGEWRSRISELTKRLNAAAKFYEMPEYYLEPEDATQPALFEGM